MRVNPYAGVDPVIRDWASRHGLMLHTQHQDSEVRSFEIPHPRQNFQLWIERPGEDGSVTVHAYNRARSSRNRAQHKLVVPVSRLNDALEEMLQWINAHA